MMQILGGPEAIDAMSTMELAAAAGGLSKTDRRRLQWRCEKDLRDDRKASIREKRVRAAKVLVALLSESLGAIESLIALRSSRWRYEVHFSLFLFVGDVRRLVGAGVDRRLLDLLGGYLMTVRAGTALAARMAADALASSWPVGDALPRLEAAATEGKYVAGRLAALSGLEEILNERGDATRSRIEPVIRSMCIRDPSAKVRRVASFALAGGD
jgi:hypothetical protein